MKKSFCLIITNLLLISVFFTGCATKTTFIYNHPEKGQINASGPILGLKSIADQRAVKDIDKIYISTPLASIDELILEEMKSTGLFSNVIIIPEDETSKKQNSQSAEIDLVMEPQLNELKWEVPNYEEMLGKVFAISFFTGGIGGFIYGSTDTDVYGDTKLNIKLINQENGDALIDKSYTGHCNERMVKLSCDTSTTKAEVIGKSIEILMKDLKKDLAQKLEYDHKNN